MKSIKIRQSLDQIMIKTNNKSTGFDYLRIILSVAVILWHSYVLSYGRDAAHDLPLIFTIPSRTILISFFALSGFLVAGSLWRCRTLFSFLGLRVIRIVPALFLEVTLSALILGPIFTDLNIKEYFTSHDFRTYFLNILGVIHYNLPGVFNNNPYPNIVNGQLWTIPYELKCYILLSILAALSITKKSTFFIIAIILIQVTIAYYGLRHPVNQNDFVPGNVMVLAFIVGVALNTFRKDIPYSFPLFAASIILSIILLTQEKGAYFVAIPLTYVTVYIGLFNHKKGRFMSSGDYSYGLYLYGFPLQQAIANFGPNLHHWLLNFSLAIFFGLGLAYFSWNYIELPTGKWRKHLLKIEDVYINIKNKMRIEKLA